MLQTTFINLRTFSFAFVMVAMLGVGTMTPVHQVAAQEASSEQRAAMLEQINMLMQLISQLMAQMQMMQAAETSTDRPTTVDTDDWTDNEDTTSNVNSYASVCPYTWTRSLNSGSRGADVKMLQRFLNLDPRTRVADRGVGSPGQESTVFGRNTAEAVSKFQVLYRADILSSQGLVNPTGIFGAAETAKANIMCAPDSTETTPFVGIIDFDADVIRENDTHGPYVEFEWEAKGVSNCSVFMDGRLILTNRGDTGNGDSRHQTSRTSLREKWGTDYKDGRNQFELRCQSRYTSKDFTVSEYETVNIDLNDDAEELDPTISLVSPNGKQTFDKSKRNDDVVVRWEAEDVPENTNVIVEIELVEAYAGTSIGGGVSQVLAKEGVHERRTAIDRIGTMGAGEYKVRVLLEECHSRGCNVSYMFGPLEENLKVYDRSSYGYFTVVDSESSDVRLRVSGYGDPKSIDLKVDDTITVNHYPVGDIDECVITGEYEKGNSVTKSSWPNVIKSGQYGRTYFQAVGPDGVLEEVRVECEDQNGRSVAEDTITFNVDEGDAGSFEITLNGDVIDEGEDVSEATAKAACIAAYNDYDTYNFNYQDVLECEWNGKVFKTVDAWKG